MTEEDIANAIYCHIRNKFKSWKCISIPAKIIPRATPDDSWYEIDIDNVYIIMDHSNISIHAKVKVFMDTTYDEYIQELDYEDPQLFNNIDSFIKKYRRGKIRSSPVLEYLILLFGFWSTVAFGVYIGLVFIEWYHGY